MYQNDGKNGQVTVLHSAQSLQEINNQRRTEDLTTLSREEVDKHPYLYLVNIEDSFTNTTTDSFPFDPSHRDVSVNLDDTYQNVCTLEEVDYNELEDDRTIRADYPLYETDESFSAGDVKITIDNDSETSRAQNSILERGKRLRHRRYSAGEKKFDEVIRKLHPNSEKKNEINEDEVKTRDKKNKDFQQQKLTDNLRDNSQNSLVLKRSASDPGNPKHEKENKKDYKNIRSLSDPEHKKENRKDHKNLHQFHQNINVKPALLTRIISSIKNFFSAIFIEMPKTIWNFLCVCFKKGRDFFSV